MRVGESCASCLYEKQQARVAKKESGLAADYLAGVRKLLDGREETDTAPYLVYQFNQLYRQYFGEESSYGELKRKYNDLVLSMEEELEKKIEASLDPLAAALLYARIGNYIDFGAMNEVDTDCFLRLFDTVAMSAQDAKTYQSFLEECSSAETFLLIADNCGEIVLDKLFLRQLKRRFPMLHVSVLVRGGEVLNDATKEDAFYVGLDREAIIVSNGTEIAGTMYDKMPEQAQKLLDEAEVILSKGQGNYECLSGQGRHIFYSFLCKCELFTDRFHVPRLTGMFVEEME